MQLTSQCDVSGVMVGNYRHRYLRHSRVLICERSLTYDVSRCSRTVPYRKLLRADKTKRQLNTSYRYAIVYRVIRLVIHEIVSYKDKSSMSCLKTMGLGTFSESAILHLSDYVFVLHISKLCSRV